MAQILSEVRTAAVQANIPFWYATQVHSWGTDHREPTPEEIRAMVSMGVAHGAKGILYFLYRSLPQYNAVGLVDDQNQPTPKWYEVQSINSWLRALSHTLLALDWQATFSVHQNTSEPISSAAALYDVRSRPVGGPWDAETETYVELGHFLDGRGLDNYVVVNRRTDPQEGREVRITFQKSPNRAYFITDLHAGQETFIPEDSVDAEGRFSFNITLSPGESALLRLKAARSGVILSQTWFGTEYVAQTGEVESGYTLTIEPGTVVKFVPATELIVHGTLQAVGTTSDSITFMSANATPAKGDWYRLQFPSGSSGSVKYANIRYATKGIFVSSASPTLQNNTIEDFSEQGIYLYNALTGANDPPVQNNTIRHGGAAGIYVTGTTPPQAKIVSNTLDDVYVGIDFEGGNYDDAATIEGNRIGQNSGGSGQSIQTALKLNTGATVEVKDSYLENGYDENLRDVGSPLANIHNNALFYGLIGYHAADYTSAGLADNTIAGNSAGGYISHWDATPNFVC